MWSGERSYEDFCAAFAKTTVYAQRTPRPGVWVAEAAGRGRWTSVFSRLERLAAHAGECDYLAASGADVLELVPEGVGVMLDPDDEHRFPLLTRVASAIQVAEEWAQLARRRGSTGTGQVLSSAGSSITPGH
ncbi:SseB family protein [Saccharopolyspora hattusasensis]|uniref:SseB family protein n=1 Tax=Saccharopolyspora hattusasensis TaxID=1128679 RepID=UPI003D98DF1F